MGILTGPITIRRYEVQGALPDDFRDDFINILQAGAFAGFEKNSDAEKAMGWATAQDPLDVDIRDFKAFRNEYLLFALRIDSRKVPSSALRMHTRQAEEEHLARSKRPKLSRNEKKEIKDLVRKKLLQQVLPSTKTCDILWNTTTKRMDFWGTSDKLNAEFIEIFEKSFSLRLRPLNPYINAVSLFPDLDDRIQGLMPSSIVHLETEHHEAPPE
jgi:DNA recombination-dependent growth factor C